MPLPKTLSLPDPPCCLTQHTWSAARQLSHKGAPGLGPRRNHLQRVPCPLGRERAHAAGLRSHACGGGSCCLTAPLAGVCVSCRALCQQHSFVMRPWTCLGNGISPEPLINPVPWEPRSAGSAL